MKEEEQAGKNKLSGVYGAPCPRQFSHISRQHRRLGWISTANVHPLYMQFIAPVNAITLFCIW